MRRTPRLLLGPNQFGPPITGFSIKREEVRALYRLAAQVPEGPFFFLSYARDDRHGDSYHVIKRFHEDLETEIAVRLGWSRPVGFMDSRDIENGDDWSDELRKALGTCCVFVPVLSR